MISAVIILTLLSVLVATEPEATGPAALKPAAPPLRPKRKTPRDDPAKPDRLAA